QLQYAKAEVAAIGALFPPIPGFPAYKERLRAITRAANELLFRVVDDVSLEYSDDGPELWSADAVPDECERFREQLLSERNAFIARNQSIRLEALREGGELERACAS